MAKYVVGLWGAFNILAKGDAFNWTEQYNRRRFWKMVSQNFVWTVSYKHFIQTAQFSPHFVVLKLFLSSFYLQIGIDLFDCYKGELKRDHFIAKSIQNPLQMPGQSDTVVTIAGTGTNGMPL